MKTVLKMSAAAAVALVCSTVSAQNHYANFGPAPSLSQSYGAGNCPSGFCGTKVGCADGSCNVACPNGQCSTAACPNGNCGVTGYGPYGTANRYAAPARPRSVGVGYTTPVSRYTVPSTRPFYGTAASANCPGGNCPLPASAHTTGYRGYPTTPNCPNGNCAPTPLPRRQPRQAPLFNLLGMNW